MSMTLQEAIAIANARATEHAPVTFELASQVLQSIKGPTARALRQLAIIKADLTRVRESLDNGDVAWAKARAQAASAVHQDEHNQVWRGQ
jgi:type IV secretory pathway VirB2 component (pilin)